MHWEMRCTASRAAQNILEWMQQKERCCRHVQLAWRGIRWLVRAGMQQPVARWQQQRPPEGTPLGRAAGACRRAAAARPSQSPVVDSKR